LRRVSRDGEGAESLGLSGRELFDVRGVEAGLQPGGALTLSARSDAGKAQEFQVRVRIDTPDELEYYRHGGILQYVLRQLLGVTA
jgi:aconitate hydratase